MYREKSVLKSVRFLLTITDRIERVATAEEPDKIFTFELDWEEVKQQLK